MAVSPEVKLAIYNDALRHIGSRRLASLTENREPRRVMDDIWGADDEVVHRALERGEWNFGIRAVQADYNPSIEPGFGFRRAFDKPDDFARLAGLSADEYMRIPLTNNQYLDEATYWFTDYDVIYIRYVSNGDTYGMNSAAWTEAFKDYIGIHMAVRACERITNATGKKDRLQRDELAALKVAKSHDAMGEGMKLLPAGSWSSSRYSSRGNRGYR